MANDTTLDPVAKNAHLWATPESFGTARAIEIGTAGEFIVCADLILQGHRAFQAAQGLPYDVVVDALGRLIRVAVKSTLAPRVRPGREGSRLCYQFAVTRTALRRGQERSDVRRYLPAEADVVALVALDRRAVAYLPVVGCPTSVHVSDPDHLNGNNRFGPKASASRYQFSAMTFAAALAEVPNA